MNGVVDKGTSKYSQTLHIGHASSSKIPWRYLGQYKYRILEDGTQTQYRLAVIESELPPHSDGPVFHFHEMHDEGFYVTKGRVRFHSPGRPHLDASAGDLITVPIRLPHKFSNPFNESAVFINTITPGFFVRYFEVLEELIGDGKTLTREVNMEALRRFATVPLTEGMVKQFEGLFGDGKRSGVNGHVKKAGKEEVNGD
ncbi:RmlC-like cupin [Ophiobolus disseminans]|uniref:RmlC-like cupin n=1 Tax=Ophiobolus disseminans TaxID=1469910 RepID=A0A6A7A3T6_9PLEO|nr:RmlC-like cupin [Ophiobolus disseminans]